MNKIKLTCVTLVGTVLLIVAANSHADVDFSTDLKIRYDDNIGWAPVSADKVSDFTTQLDAAVNWVPVRSATAELAFDAGAYYAWVADLTDLSHYGLTVDADYSGQANPELTAFWWDLNAKFVSLTYQDSDIRDGWAAEASVTVGKRFNEKFGLSGGLRYEKRASTDNNPANQPPNAMAQDVFDLENFAAYIRAAFSLGASTDLYAEYTFRSGDVASTGREFSNGGQFARAFDYAFGPEYIVWRIDADQNIIDVGITQQITDSFSMEFSLGYLDASGEQNNDYSNTYASLGGFFRF
jgi:hypothetical protein